MQNVIIKPHIFDDREAVKFELVEGCSVADFIKEAKLPVALNNHIRASVNGVPLSYTEFSAPLKKTDLVNIYVVPMGGGGSKNIFRLVAIIAVVAVAPYLAGGVGLIAGGALATAAGQMGLSMAFTALGMMAVNALIKPPSLNTGGYNAAPSAGNTYTITGQSNQISPYGVIPRLYGTHLFFPRLCAQPLVWNSGVSSYMTALYDFGYDRLELADVRIGATSIDSFVTNTNILQSTKGAGLRYYTKLLNLQQISAELKYNNQIIRETADDASTAEVEIQFPQGLVDINKKGAYLNSNVKLEASYRKAGSSDPFTAVNISAIGAGVIHNHLTKTVDILLTLGVSQGWWYPVYYYYLPQTTTITVNTNYDLKPGDQIAAVVEFGNYFFSALIGERRTVLNNVPKGNGVTVQIDRPFTNLTRSANNNLANTKYFPTSYDRSTTSTISVQNNKTTPFTATVKFLFPEKDRYEISIKRTTADSGRSTLINKTSWTLLRTFQNDTVLDLDTEHTLMELNLRANEQINGVVENLSAICSSYLRTWNGTAFITEITNNPAWVVLDILTGDANEGAILDSQIDLESFLDFANYCDEIVQGTTTSGQNFQSIRHTCNLVITSETTVSDLVQSILSQSRASLKISANGKFGVLFDVEKSDPVQLFTTRNSSNFSSKRTYADIPHALKIKYVNPLQSYEIDEVVVYADGYNRSNATVFETVETFGLTDYYEAYRHGRYTLAQMIAYQEIFTIDVDLEHLSVQRGELVSVQNDVPRIGGTPARVKEVLNGGETIIVNDVMGYDGLSEYHYLVRANDLTIETGAIDSVVSGTEVHLVVPNPNIKPGDIFVYGFKDLVTKDYLVSSIMPKNELKASLTLVPYNPDVYTADTGEMPDYESGIAPEIINECRVEIQDLSVEYSLTYQSRLPVPTFTASWSVGDNATLKKYLVEWADEGTTGSEYIVAGYTNDTDFVFTLGNLINNPSLVNSVVYIRVTAIGINDKLCIPSEPVTLQIKPDDTIPADVEFFNINIVSETLNLTWLQNPEPDILYYVIKYHPSLDSNIATWERSTVLTDSISYDTLRHTTNARKGTYFIKAIDSSGNMSANAARAITIIPEIVGLNFVDKIQDDPQWTGNKENFVLESGNLLTVPDTTEPTCEFTMCDGRWRDSKPWSDSITWTDEPFDYSGTDYATQARYTFDRLLDLGDIYTARINTQIDAFGFMADELMYRWVKLSDIDSLGSTDFDEWNAYITLKTTDVLGSISEWDLLSNVVTMAEGSSDNWTEYLLAEMGDFTGRYFRFYLNAETTNSKIRIEVKNAIVNVDMPDRIISENDLVTAAQTYRVNFSPAFFVTPAIGVTQDNAAEGDRYVIENKDRTGFDITFYDSGNNPVSRQFDYMAKAYGSLVFPTGILNDYST